MRTYARFSAKVVAVCIATSLTLPATALAGEVVIGRWSFEAVDVMEPGVGHRCWVHDERVPGTLDPGALGSLLLVPPDERRLVLVQSNRRQTGNITVDYFDIHYSTDGVHWTVVRDASTARSFATNSWVFLKAGDEPVIVSRLQFLAVRLERILEYLPADAFARGSPTEFGVLVKVELVSRRPFAAHGEDIPMITTPIRIRRAEG